MSFLNKLYLKVQTNRDSILKAVKKNGLALEHVKKLFKQDKEIVLEAVKEYLCLDEQAHNLLLCYLQAHKTKNTFHLVNHLVAILLHDNLIIDIH